MRFLFFIAAIALYSCGQPADKTKNTETDTLQIKDTANNPAKDSVAVTESKQTVSYATVTSILQSKFPGKWKIINDSIDNWPVDMFDYFIKDKRKNDPDYPYISKGDYNADGKTDYAALVVNTTNKDEHRIAILLDSNKIIIWNDDVRGGAMSTHPKTDVGGMDGKVAKLKSEAINVEFYEKSSWVLYWNGSAFKKIWTGD